MHDEYELKCNQNIIEFPVLMSFEELSKAYTRDMRELLFFGAMIFHAHVPRSHGVRTNA